MKKAVSLILAIIMVLTLAACGEKEPEKKPGEVRWPNTELVNRLPVPESLSGKVLWESSEDFSVELINISQEQYEEYVNACMDKGFTVDYYRDEEDFWALDAEGYDLSVDYDADMLVMGISIDIPDEEGEDTQEDPDTTTTTTTTTAKTTTTATKSDSISSDFKAAMDAYEAFMNKYVDFMKKYQSNPTDLGLLADYATYMSDYAKFCDDFAKWEDEELNTAELAYYVDVQSRVTKKLLEVAG